MLGWLVIFRDNAVTSKSERRVFMAKRSAVHRVDVGNVLRHWSEAMLILGCVGPLLNSIMSPLASFSWLIVPTALAPLGKYFQPFAHSRSNELQSHHHWALTLGQLEAHGLSVDY